MRFLRLLGLLICCFLPGLCGCTTLRQGLGLRVKLAKTPLSAMAASLPQQPGRQPGIAPGEQAKMVATFTEPNGKGLATEGAGKGKVAWTELKVTTTLVSAKKGTLSLPQDPRVSEGRTGRVDVTVPSHPGLSAGFDVPVRYDFAYMANFSGANGNDGQAGTDGQDGSSGSDGSTDPNSPSPGGNGGNGTNGGSGGSGGDGGSGANITVEVTLKAGPRPLLQVSVTAGGSSGSVYYLVDPDGGSLSLYADGGAGGSGGKGGRGGSGGAGGSGSPPGSSGSSGVAGTDGSSGSDGSPGRITVTYDASAQPYLQAIVARGQAKASFSEGVVGPLW